MIKKVIAISIVLFALTIAIYNHFNKPDVDSYSIVHDIGTYSSSDSKHEIVLQLCLSDISGSSRYIMGTLVERNFNTASSKVIYWDKLIDEDQSKELINVEWIDKTTVKIGDIVFDITNFPNVDIYNYRTVYA